MCLFPFYVCVCMSGVWAGEAGVAGGVHAGEGGALAHPLGHDRPPHLPHPLPTPAPQTTPHRQDSHTPGRAVLRD